MKMEAKEKQQNSSLDGLTFVFTGRLEQMTRNEASELVEGLGCQVLSSVSKKLDYLVVGEKAGSKLEKARKLGTKIISEQEFLDMVG